MTSRSASGRSIQLSYGCTSKFLSPARDSSAFQWPVHSLVQEISPFKFSLNFRARLGSTRYTRLAYSLSAQAKIYKIYQITALSYNISIDISSQKSYTIYYATTSTKISE